ncbi:hypothetical protein [Phenylobacterium hankyongense]|uniref:hypothetical protein n=1 Tax=Phenylobacterium hankyongense TaxID=1813876 RepID=UPI0010583395|nr:hypothetical protein [Phenylobacterium hankyongense]
MKRPLAPIARLAPVAVLALGAGLAAAPAAHAAETACWFEGGVVVVPAEVMGVAGDYVLDTATAHTQLGETQAQGAGFADTALKGEVRIGGMRLTGQPVAVAGLDMRTGALPTPIAGVIGADVLRAFVVDVRFAPCRVVLSRPGEAPPFGRATALPLTWTGDTPTVAAAVSDGGRTLSGPFAPATGGERAVRLADDLAAAPGASKPQELYPYGVARPRLRALSFAGALSENLPAGLLKAQDGGPAGEIGTPVLARYRLRFDFPNGRLLLAPDG